MPKTAATIRKIATTLLAFLLLTMSLPADSQADRERGRHHYSPYRQGHIIGKLPHGARVIHVHRSPYYFYDGIFYQPRPSGYVVVSAPIGAIVASLPLGHARISIGGALYFTFGNTYYRQVPQGYLVVAPPPDVIVDEQPEAPIYSSVHVVVNRLNVRSGPGRDHPIVFQLHRGAVLTVYGTSPGWYYVQLPNGQYGWIMEQFTRMSGPPPADG